MRTTRRVVEALLLVLVAVRAPPARAEEPRPAEPRTPDTNVGPLVRLDLPGEYVLRGNLRGDIPLTAPGDDPGATTLGQNVAVLHWLRLSPRLSYGESLRLHAQIDLLRGLVAADRLAAYTGAAAMPLGDFDGYSHVDPRWLYLEWQSPWGVLRAGQMGSQWGTGMFVNDGNQESLFGDHLYGDIVERIAFATRPHQHSPWLVVVAGDLVFRDRAARLTEGDVALQAVLALAYDRGGNQAGLYAAYRSQRNADGGDLGAAVLDAFFRAETPSRAAGGQIFFAAEVATVLGTTSLTRTTVEPRQDLVQGGGIAVAGFRNERVSLSIEAGWASGDSNPLDDRTVRFSMSPDHNVGLVLFDEVLAWQTARSATLAAKLVARPPPGIDLLPTNGAVAGAVYLNPVVRVAIADGFSVFGGLVVAQSTTEIVDPYRIVVESRVANYRGGDSRSRDLGVEADLGVEFRRALGPTKLRVGLQAGYFWPGRAFDDDQGRAMPPVGLVQARAGVVF